MSRITLSLALLVLVGCALEGHPAGTQLAQGRNIEAPVVVWDGARPLVLFDTFNDARTDLHALPFDGQAGETLWPEASTNGTWLLRSGDLIAEQPPGFSVFSLTSSVPQRTWVGALDQVAGDSLLFHQGDGTGARAFLSRVADEKLWDLGSLAQHWLAEDGHLVYLSSLGILRALDPAVGVVTTADRLASAFTVAPDQRTLVARDRPDASARPVTRDRLMALPSFESLAVAPLGNPGCATCVAWLGFSPDSRSFYYGENLGLQGNLIRQWDLQTLEATETVAQARSSANHLLWGPGGDLALLGASSYAEGDGRGILTRAILRPGPSLTPLSGPVAEAKFFPSGVHLLYQDALIGGRLLVVRTDALAPEPAASALPLSPEGSLLDGSCIDGDSETVLFWARPMAGKSSITLVRSAERSDLYAARAPTFTVRRLAEAVDTVAVGQGYALALARFSPQDLTGDLMLFDLRTGRAQTLASPVSAFWASADCPSAGAPPLRQRWQGLGTRVTAIGPACSPNPSLLLTFVVRGRVSSSRDGLWSLSVPLSALNDP